MRQYVDVPLTAICGPENPLRVGIEDEGIHELGRSIREVGVLQPLVVRKVANGYEVIAGHRRLLACRMVGLDRVPVRVVEAEEHAREVMALSENVIRRDLNAIEEARQVERMRAVLGLSVGQISERVGKSEAWVRSRLELLTWPLRAVEAVAQGKAKVAALAPLMAIGDTGERDRLIECAVESGATAAVTRVWAAGVAGEAAPVDGSESARSRAAMPVAEYVVEMPCFGCRVMRPALQLRFIRVCDGCLNALGPMADVSSIEVEQGEGAPVIPDATASGAPEAPDGDPGA